MTRIALIHALAHSVAPVNEAMARDWPGAVRMNLLDDSLSADLAAAGALDAAMHERLRRLARYAVDCGSDAILFTCSAFGPCIEAVARELAPLPVLKPNEAMIDERVAQAASRLAEQGCTVIALAQFSLARARGRVEQLTGLPVFTTVDSAVRELQRRLPSRPSRAC